MRLILPTLLIAFFGGIVACDDSPTDGDGSGTPALIAGYEYINWAWGFQQEYVLINDRGSVYQSFPSINDSLYLLDSLTAFTQADFDKLLAKADSLTERLTAAELRLVKQYAVYVAADSVTECVHTGNDLGGAQTFLFVHQPNGTFHRELLRRTGDWTCYNLHPSVPLLDSIILQYHLHPGH